MFRSKQIGKDLYLLKTCRAVLGRPLMWAYFLLADDTLIDSGNSGCDHKALLDFARERDVRTIFNTHLHEDHCGNNGLLQRALGVRIMACEPIPDYSFVTAFYRLVWGMPGHFTIERPEGDTIHTGAGRELRIIASPGHCPGHVSVSVPNPGILFTGDAIALASCKTYCNPDEDYVQQVLTLRELSAMMPDIEMVIDAHSGLLSNPTAHIQTRIENMTDVVRTVRDSAERHGEDIRTIAREVFGKGNWYDIFTGPRISLENTVRSILRNPSEL